MSERTQESEAIYAAMVAYTREHKRIRAKGDDRVNGRCLLVAIRKFNAEMAEDDIDLIDDEATP